MTFPRKALSLILIPVLLLQSLSAAPAAPAQKKKKAATPAAAKETANFSPVDVLVQEQINDQTIPYMPGAQLGGHVEGVLRDTISRGFRADAALAEQALALLDEWFSPAYPALLGEPRALVQWQAPRI